MVAFCLIVSFFIYVISYGLLVFYGHEQDTKDCKEIISRYYALRIKKEMQYGTIAHSFLFLSTDYISFETSDCRMTAVVTNVDTGEAKYKPLTDFRGQMQWLWASCSLPLIF